MSAFSKKKSSQGSPILSSSSSGGILGGIKSGGLTTGGSNRPGGTAFGGRPGFSGGGRGDNSTNQTRVEENQRAAAAEAARQAQIIRERQLEEARKARVEKIRIENLKKTIVDKGAQIRQQQLRNQIGQKIIVTNYTLNKIEKGKATNVIISESKNLATGETKTRTLEGRGSRGRSGGYYSSPEMSYPEPKAEQKLNKKETKKLMSLPGKYYPFVSEFRDLATALDRSKKGGIVKETFKIPAKVVSNFVPIVWDNLLQTPANIAFLVVNPKAIKEIPKNLVSSIKQDITLIKTSPTKGVAKVGADYFTFRVLFGGLKVTGKVGGSVNQKLNPFIKRFDKRGVMIIRKPPVEVFEVYGRKRLLKERVLQPSIKRPFSSVADFIKKRKPGQFKRFTKDPGLILKKQTVASGATSLSNQARLAGKEVTAVNAAADQITSWIRRRKIIRKPIQGEANFPPEIKKILARFDGGKGLTNNEFAKINKWLQKNVAPNITLLERSLYLDPASGIRLSRLGIQSERTASLRDILRGNFRLFGSGKPQVLIFEKAKVARFPKSLSGIKTKLLKNEKLTPAETNKLIRWQIQSGSGQFKPIGSTIYAGGRELEITLAPGELIKRLRKVGTFYQEGKKVSIVTAEIYKPSSSILKQIKLARLGKLSEGSLQKLETFLSKALRRRVRVETPSSVKRVGKEILRTARRSDPNIPVLRVSGLGLRVIPRGVRIPSRFSSRFKNESRVNRTPRTDRSRVNRTPRTDRSRVNRTPRTDRRPRTNRRGGNRRLRVPREGVPGTPPRVLGIIPPGFAKRKLSKKVDTFYVVEKRRGRFRKLFPKPLTLKDARDFGVYSIDNRLSKTAFLVPIGKNNKVVRPPKQITNYYSNNKYKVRPYRIRFGKRKLLVNGFIEKRRFFSDTSGERGALRNLRIIKSRGKPFRRKIRSIQRPRRTSPSNQRQIMLRNLARARRIRMLNLRRRRK